MEIDFASLREIIEGNTVEIPTAAGLPTVGRQAKYDGNRVEIPAAAGRFVT